MQQQLGTLSLLDTGQIEQMMPRPEEQQQRKPPQRVPTSLQKKKFSRSLAEQAIHILLNHPEFAIKTSFPQGLSALSDQHIPLIFELIKQITIQPEMTTGQLLEHWRESPSINTFTSLISGSKELPDEAMFAEYKGIVESPEKSLEKQQRSAIIQTSNGKITDQIKSIYKRSNPDQE
jgi:DNA primase